MTKTEWSDSASESHLLFSHPAVIASSEWLSRLAPVMQRAWTRVQTSISDQHDWQGLTNQNQKALVSTHMTCMTWKCGDLQNELFRPDKPCISEHVATRPASQSIQQHIRDQRTIVVQPSSFTKCTPEHYIMNDLIIHFIPNSAHQFKIAADQTAQSTSIRSASFTKSSAGDQTCERRSSSALPRFWAFTNIHGVLLAAGGRLHFNGHAYSLLIPVVSIQSFKHCTWYTWAQGRNSTSWQQNRVAT